VEAGAGRAGAAAAAAAAAAATNGGDGPGAFFLKLAHADHGERADARESGIQDRVQGATSSVSDGTTLVTLPLPCTCQTSSPLYFLLVTFGEQQHLATQHVTHEE